MECLNCAKQLRRKIAPITGFYDGETFTVKTQAIVCPYCGFSTVDAPHLDEYYRAVADAYRTAHGRLTSDQIVAARKRLKMSQRAFARFLGVGEASIKRWELGKVQDRAMDELIRLKTHPSYAAGGTSLVSERKAPYTIPIRVSGCDHRFELAGLHATIRSLKAEIAALTRRKRKKRRT